MEIEDGDSKNQVSRQYIQDSSDEDLPEGSSTIRRRLPSKPTTHRKLTKPLPAAVHAIKEEVSPRSGAGRPARGIRQLLDVPPRPKLDGVEDSDTDSDQNRGNKIQSVTPRHKAPQSLPGDVPGRMIGDFRGPPPSSWQNLVGIPCPSFATSHALPGSIKKQRVFEAMPVGQQPATGDPTSVQRTFLASHLPTLANVPSSAVRTTPKKGITRS